MLELEEELDELLLEELLLELLVPSGLQAMPFRVKPDAGSAAGGLVLLALNPKLTLPLLAGMVPFHWLAGLDAVISEPLLLKVAFQPELKLSPGFNCQTSS